MNRKKKMEIRLRNKLEGHRKPSDVLKVVDRAEKEGFKQLLFQARKILGRM